MCIQPIDLSARRNAQMGKKMKKKGVFIVDYIKKTGRKESIWITLLITITFFIFGPMELYYTNIDEFFFEITKILGGGVKYFLVVSAILLVIQNVWKNKQISGMISAVLFAVGLGLYIQGNWINADYGVLNGSTINWDEYKLYGIINTCIWIGLIAVSVILFLKLKKEIIEKIHIYLSGIIIAAEIVTLLTLIFMTSGKISIKVGNDKQFTVGDEENIIIFLLDNYDSGVFSELLHSEYGESIKEQFQDFTYYDNMSGGYPFTTYAIPLILSGKWYENSIKYNDFLENESYSKSELFEELSECGYSVGLYTSGRYLGSPIVDFTRNLHLGKENVSSSGRVTLEFLKLTAFRYFPHELKQFTLSEESSFDKYHEETIYQYAQDLKFYDKLKEEGITVEKGKSFIFYHLMGVHVPYLMDENACADENATEKSQALGSLTIIESYMDYLKENGIYDCSTIVVMADHGYKGIGQNPLFMVKEAETSHEFIINSSPVSYDDLQGTYFYWLNGDANGLTTIYDFEEEEKRTRYFRWHATENTRKQEIPLVEYAITGNAGNMDSIQMTGRLYGKDGSYEREVIKFESELKIDCSSGGNYGETIASNYRWGGNLYSWGEYTDFLLDTSNYAESDVKLDIVLSNVFSAPQRLQLYFNGEYIGEKTASVPGEIISYVIPRENFQKELTRIRLLYPDMAEEVEGYGEYMAVAFDYIQLSQLEELGRGKEYDFGIGGNADKIIWDGMSVPEEGLRWSCGEKSNFYWSIPTEAEIENITFQIKLKLKISDDQKLKIYMNDNFLGEITLDELEFKVNVPAEILKEGINDLRIEYPNAISPKELNGSEDDRKLSVAYENLTVQ